MTLNVSDERTDESEAATREPARHERRALISDLLGELTAWNPQERSGLFRLLHRGSFSLIHLNVVIVLESEGPLPMRRLAESLDVSDASATGIVDRMEKRGVVERRHATDDRRLVLVHLTDAGRKLFQDIEGHRRDHLLALLNELSEPELAGLLIGVRGLHAARERLRLHALDEAAEAARADGAAQSEAAAEAEASAPVDGAAGAAAPGGPAVAPAPPVATPSAPAASPATPPSPVTLPPAVP